MTAMEHISTTNFSGGQVTISNIPQGYEDLKILMHLKMSGNEDTAVLKMNNNNSSDYGLAQLFLDSGNVLSVSSPNNFASYLSSSIQDIPTSSFHFIEMDVLGYSRNRNPKFLARHAGQDTFAYSGGTHDSGGPLTSFTVDTGGGQSFASNCQIIIYGVLA